MTNTTHTGTCTYCGGEVGRDDQTLPFPHECATAWTVLLATASEPGEFLLTACEEHGTKSCDWNSAPHYVELVRESDREWVWHADGTITLTASGARWHAENGTSPWRCCSRMVIDPFGCYDY